MSTELTTQTKEPDIPSPLQVKIDEAKKFVKKYQVPIAFSVGAVATGYLVRDIQLYTKRDILNTVRGSIGAMLDNNDSAVPLDDQAQVDFLTLCEFIADKGLLEEYSEFYDKMNT